MVSDTNQCRFVCVIGGGPSGLVSARELKREGHSVVVFEQRSDVGGQWLYEPVTKVEDVLVEGSTTKVHSSVYASLRLTSSREIMGFSDFPFRAKKGRDMRRFPGHRELYLYLRDYCDRFGLRELIRFNTNVEYVGIVDSDEFGTDLKWVVRAVEKKSEKVIEEVFDAVVVATGHYSQPRLPSITGMDTWKRKKLHSHIYRVPEPFLGEVVVVVGNSLSGQDVSMELVGVAKEVHLSAKSMEISEGLSKIISKTPSFHIHQQINSLHEDGRVSFSDGSWITADTIIFCTGYSYTFPFLDTKGIVAVDDDRVEPLFEHTFPPSLAPSLSFVGIPRKILFSFFEVQARWIAQVLSKKRALPSWDEMMKSIKDFYQSMEAAGVPKHKTHDVASFEYCNKYGEYCDYPPIEQWKKEIVWATLKNADANLESYREAWDDDEWLQQALESTHFDHF
ncbi:flavin-containing monooxygenase FMO GS-OX-like 9 [Aristolochia californica]|uniref:flavin-containing monooxygenase FMO GS-OX-like 9 n=1 Tax=Aristolochia californica TaxID=171875 RepID=UPI0035D84CA1